MSEGVETPQPGVDPGLEGGGKGKKKRLSPIDGKLSSKAIAGWDNTNISEKQPNYVKAECEHVVRGGNNTYVILGRDRHAGLSSGYGGRGHTRAGAIDIVVGLQGFAPDEGGRDTVTGWRNGNADKNFGSMNNGQPGDAARIYISQRADVDKYFDIADGFVGQSIADSAIAMKADSIRIMARKGIKIVTGKNPPGRNSLDGKIKVTYGIDLIAGNRDFKTGMEQKLMKYGFGDKEINYLQPIPKGENLVEYLKTLHEEIDRLNSCITNLLKALQNLHNLVRLGSVGWAGPTAVYTEPWLEDLIGPIFEGYVQRIGAELSTARTNSTLRWNDYLKEGGAFYVNSRHNRTN
jgi:hypothetical protein